MKTALPPLSILDLSPITEGGDAAESLSRTRDLARHADELGYNRYWLAEHHNMAGIASAATAVVIGHVASATTRIRIGAGGIMLPNHAPLVIAEQFGTLESLHPGRIDLGLGRAPGTDPLTARALRRDLQGSVDTFPDDVVELRDYFAPPRPDQHVRAVPGAGLRVPLWILGSSLYGAQLAAMLGLPYAFASHFAPGALLQALEIYRDRFQPSEQLQSPYAMAGFNVFAAESVDEAELLRSSSRQAMLNLRRGKPRPLPPPDPNFDASLNAAERAMLDEIQACSVAGAPSTVRDGLTAFVERTGVDEVIVASQIYDHSARLRSYEIVAEVALADDGH